CAAWHVMSGGLWREMLLPRGRRLRGTDLDEETTADGDRTIAREIFVDGRASMPVIPAAGAPPPPAAGRASMPSLELPPHVVDSRPRAASMAEIAIEPPRGRVPWGTLLLAI